MSSISTPVDVRKSLSHAMLGQKRLSVECVYQRFVSKWGGSKDIEN